MMDASWLADLTASATVGYGPYDNFFSYVTGTIGTSADKLVGQTLLYKMGKGTAYRDAAVAAFDTVIAERTDSANDLDDSGYQIALAYDLLYDDLTDTQRKNAVDSFVGLIDLGNATGTMANYTLPLWNYQIAYWGPMMMVSAAGAGDTANVTNDLATEYATLKNGLWTKALTILNSVGKGEAPEGTFYSTNKNTRFLLQAAEAIYNAEGDDIYADNSFFGNRLTWEWQTFGSTPKTYDSVNTSDYMRYYQAWGHSERFRATVYGQSRANQLLLLYRQQTHQYVDQVYYSLYSNTDTDLNQSPYASTNSLAIFCFLYNAKDVATASAPSLQFWATNSGEDYGPGKAFMRSGYDDDDIYITYKSGDIMYRGHENLDEGTFQILANGEELAIHSGTYPGSGDKEMQYQYYEHAVSANGLVIYDKNESFWYMGMSVDNTGGQRTYSDSPQMYEAFTDWASAGTAYSSNAYTNPAGVNHLSSLERSSHVADQYSYVFSDLTRAYNSDTYVEGAEIANTAKVSEVTREFTFVANKYIVVHDRINKKAATSCSGSELDGVPCDNQDKWLLHTKTTYSINGTETTPSTDEYLYTGSNGTFTTTVNSAKLFGKIILPSGNYQIRRFTGTKRYWNYVQSVPKTDNQGNWYDIDYGLDRLEIEPTDTGLEHNYLVVLMPGETTDSMPTITGIDATNFEGAVIADSTQPQVVMFADDGDTHDSVAYTATYTGTGRHIVTGLDAGEYDLTVGGSDEGTVTADNDGVATFTAIAGVVDLTLTGVTPTPVNVSGGSSFSTFTGTIQ